MLGTGTASGAARLLGTAKSRIDAAVNRAVSGKPAKKKQK